MIDALMSRVIVETVVCIIIAVVIISVLHLLDTPLGPASWSALVSGLILSSALGVSVGLAISTFVAFNQVFAFFVVIVYVITWAFSEAFLIADSIPDPFRFWLSFNPLLQCTELIRVAYYPKYSSSILDVPY
jgi:capsular polysaccharide transport system permease protein